MATEAQRAHLHALMLLLVAHEPLIHYAQRRPMTLTTLREQELADTFSHGGTVAADCSEAVTALCLWAGLADPNGRGYNGTGYTGTMLSRLPHYSVASHAEVGALVVYGPDTGDHVAMVYEPGRDPLLFSHGQERGPVLVRHSVERKAHRPPYTFLSVARL